ncbi:hypothetical protein C7382_101135 [Porphyromonas loveana]|uniref:Uncharacterized protein n=1 Tax=Porphyromonas loveana TaxID=1884669 RepID=A0A2U1FSQ1_9PORP|nr:hypothetical protein C7382_101135 [Porphyromonas loveana]
MRQIKKFLARFFGIFGTIFCEILVYIFENDTPPLPSVRSE